MAIRKALALFGVVAALAGAALWHAGRTAPVMIPAVKHISIGKAEVVVDVADTEAAREQGLSGRASLPDGQGMLFIFQTDDTWGIWMKDMRFSIDILWANASGTVVAVAHDVSPDTYPKPFYPASPARYVVELPSGFAAREGIAEGTKIVI